MSFSPKMSEHLDKTYHKRPLNKRTFAWISMEDNSDDDCVNNENSEVRSVESNESKSGFDFIPFNDCHNNESNTESNDENRRQTKRANNGLIWCPFGENSINTIASNESTFCVPQRLPSKLKKKLTPLKITPARRPSLSTNSVNRRNTYRITPNSRTHLNLMSKTTIKKRRSSGSSSSTTFGRTPKNKSSLVESHLKTPSSSVKSCISVEEIQYLSWINEMLAPKAEEKNEKIDCNQLIIDCFNTTKVTLSVCPTKEEMSVNTYQELIKLNQLRTSANALYRREDIQKINRKIVYDIRNDKYSVRKDRAIHADIGVRKHIMNLLLSYNPLWLRIGLETVYNQKIAITSTPMRISLSKFIAENLLESKELMAKYGHKTITHFFKDEVHINEAKKYILTKFLFLLNFLDFAKREQLIQHNPCLFRIKSEHKSTLELIVSFARDYITGVGDITKYLKNCGFSIGYKQMPIEEFDFEAVNLAVDLRCGIRLSRLAELMANKKDLLSQLWFPANTLIRKQHNVETALNAFRDIVPESITSKDIANGHRKKTFDLLDAIIFKHKEDLILMEQKTREQSVVLIQRLFRANRLMKVEKQKFEKLKYFTIVLQKRFRENKAQRVDRRERLRREKSVLLIQRKFRANRLMRTERENYQKLKLTTISVQRVFRANRVMRIEREKYQKLKTSVICIQRKFRKIQIERQETERLEKSVVLVQRIFRSNRQMRIESENYRKLKFYSNLMQTKFRANRVMRIEREKYQKLKYFTICIQKNFRQKRIERLENERLEKYTLLVQRIFRANGVMRIERENYRKLKFYTIFVQKKFREIRLKRIQRLEMERLEKSVLLIQRKLRANRLMRIERENYQKLKLTTISVQRVFRANRVMRIEREKYQKLKSSVVCIQKKFRENRIKRIERREKERLIKFAIFVQRKFRANRLMRIESENYTKLKSSVICIQRKFRTILIERREKERLEKSVVLVQRIFRSKRRMRIESENYRKLKFYSILIQNKFRANRDMRIQREKYQKLKYFTICIQKKFRQKRIQRMERQEREKLGKNVIVIQSRFRANRLMRIERKNYTKLKFSTNLIQKKWREKLVEIKRTKAVIKIQSHWRGYITRKSIHENNKKVETAFKRIVTTTSLATEDMLLGNRTFNALQKLLGYDSLLHLSYDLEALDKTTKLSPDSCVTIACNGAVKILVQILQESNRSEPHKAIVALTINILYNLAKFEKTLPKLETNPQMIEILFKIIKNFNRQKDIISKCLTLLWILIQNQTLFENVMTDKRKIDAIKQVWEHSKREKEYKKYRLKSTYKFWPNWQIAKSNVYQFDNYFIAIQAIANRLNVDK